MTTLKELLKPVKKVRKCPHCKSNKGFEYSYGIVGNGIVHATFNGKTIHSEREVFDQAPNYVECLNCHKSIDVEKVKTDYI